jgi:hypothetical protein
MAKEIGSFEIIIRGTSAGGPTEQYIQYQIRESTDHDLCRNKSSAVETPNFAKKVHDAGTAGELWKDLLDATKTAEGIS